MILHRMVRLSVLLVVAVCAGAVQADEHQFVGSSKCSICHKLKLMGKQYGVWKSSAHAKAYETLGSDRAQEYAEAAGLEEDPQTSADCLRCHVTGYGVAPERFKRRRPNLTEGVGCESCHGAGRDYQNKDTMSDLELAKSKGLRIPVDADCRECHNDETPAWDPERYTLADGSRAGFDFEQAMKLIAHPIPPDVKGHYLEIKAKRKGGK